MSVNTYVSLNKGKEKGEIKRLDQLLTCIFFICISLAPLYFVSLRLYSPLSPLLLWIPIIAVIFIITFQIMRVSSFGYEIVIILEIIALNLVLAMFYKVPFYGLRDTDSYMNMMVIRKTLQCSNVESFIKPLFKIIGTELNLITEISPFDIVKWFPLVTSSFFLFLLFSLIKGVFKSSKVALLATLLMTTLQPFSEFSAPFHYERFTQIIMLTMLCFMIQTKRNITSKFLVLSILCLLAIILSHHLTPLVLMIFLAIHLTTSHILNLFPNKNLLQKREAVLNVAGILVLIVFLGVFLYWIHIYDEPLQVFVKWAEILIYGEFGKRGIGTVEYVSPEALPSLRAYVIFYGFWVFQGIFAIILLYNLLHSLFLSKNDNKSVDFFSFTLFLFFCGVLGVFNYFLIPKCVGLPVSRILVIGWIWGFAPLTICILGAKKRWRKIGVAILVAFMLFNMYMTPLEVWDPHVRAKGDIVGNIVLKEDYALAKTIPLKGKVAAYHKTRLAILDVQGFYCRDLTSISSIEELKMLDWIIIKKGQLGWYAEHGGYEKYSVYEYNAEVVERLLEFMDGNSHRDKVYESKNLVVFK